MPDVRDSFNRVASNYSKSWFLTAEDRLQEVLELAKPKKGDLVIDVATGTGNTAFVLAPHVRRVIGVDLTREMLVEGRRVAAEKKIDNVDWMIGDAVALPFQDDTFDLYIVRAAPHHFPDIHGFLAEAYRVLRPGRDAVFIDCSSPVPARDLLHEVEVRRDPAHILSLTLDEWTHAVEHAGFEIEVAQSRELDWDYEKWMGTQAVKPELAAELAKIIEGAEGEARTQLHPERRDGKLWHAYWHCLIRAEKPA
jgi:ubiquinone/menaquinone biosynthesis C-methylase UbiE